MKRVIINPIIAISFALLLAACSGDESSRKISITNLEWVSNNIATDFWPNPPEDGNTAFYTFYIEYDGVFTASDIESASVSVGGVTWTLADEFKRSGINSEAKTIVGGYFCDDDTPHSLPVGTATATIRLVAGQSSTYTRVIPVPGSREVAGYSSMHDEGYPGTPPATSAPMLKRATASYYSKNADVISAQFTIDDLNAQNGDLWLYSASGAYVGVTRLFCDPISHSPDPAIVSSFYYYSANVINVDSSEIEFEDGFTFGDIAAFRVVIFDGYQYEPKNILKYDSRSVSSKYSF